MKQSDWWPIAFCVVWVIAILLSSSQRVRNKVQDMLGKGRRRKLITGGIIFVLAVLVVLRDTAFKGNFVWSHFVVIGDYSR
jgi:hypothetical protein